MSSPIATHPIPTPVAGDRPNAGHPWGDFACTSLIYEDAQGAFYLGRTLELTVDLPYQLAYLPAGLTFSSRVGVHPAVSYTTRFPTLAVVMPDRRPTPAAPLSMSDLKVVEGVNAAGLTFSLLAYPTVGGTAGTIEKMHAVLAATDLGTWTLGMFQNVRQVKAALAEQPVALDAIDLLGGQEAPFHYVLHDRRGESVVLEFDGGRLAVYDNPVGVLTNGPQFPWHLTNLGNYTGLSNVDRSSATFGKLDVRQPDSGMATANLPASNTSVGRFVRAVYYAQFAEKVADPDQAIRTLAHIMNNFDRPKGITVAASADERGLEIEGLASGGSGLPTEFTSWTNLTDLNRSLFFVRTYHGLNYTMFDLAKLAATDTLKLIPLSTLDGMAADGTDALLESKPG